ncbi:CRTAC1 family protein [Rhodocaloribacter litoris]|uniref:CRTAC1 family protein n=1 Tax=Rhodocaloribacter litoris TaxID=2558931 RepID=UPI001420F937|nr:CRTAC1 family protein [Rhodocaloribacter litoris]QXD16363.1 CRTAC1 family protein [Rhodocaloribacter litoris]
MPARSTSTRRCRRSPAPALLLAAVFLAAGGAGCGAPGSSEPSRPPATAPAARPAFTDLTTAAGLGDFRHENGARGDTWFPETMGSGGGFLDANGDGHPDIVLVGGGAWTPEEDRAVRKLWLYLNNGDGTFTLAPAGTLPDDLPGYGMGLAVADYDNDGDDDLFFTTLGPDHLLRNDGGVFTDVTRSAGLPHDPTWSTAALFFDADRDGHLDLYVAGYVKWSPETDLFCSQDGENKGYCTPELYEGVPGRFYHNRGDGTFEDRTAAAGFDTATGKTLGVIDLDFNRDGWPDLAFANDTDPDQLYRNNGDGTFTETGVASGIAFDEQGRARAGMGIDAGVVDPSGEETLFVGNFSNEMISVYRHLGHGVFLDRAAASQIGRTSLLTLTFSVFLFDADLDGDLDLFAANGHVQPHIERVSDQIRFRQPPHLFLNDGNGTFTDIAPELGGVMTRPLVARAAATADIDRDGDLDVLLTENAGPAHLWRNDLDAPRHWLRVDLEGRVSNRDGLGARIEILAGGQRQVRRVRRNAGFLSTFEKTATFGLGNATRVDSLVVYWPGGHVDRFAGIETNQTVRVIEGEALLRPQAPPKPETRTRRPTS